MSQNWQRLVKDFSSDPLQLLSDKQILKPRSTNDSVTKCWNTVYIGVQNVKLGYNHGRKNFEKVKMKGFVRTEQ